MPKPFCIVTNTGEPVSLSALDKYACKSSQQIQADSFEGLYNEGGVIKPLYDPDKLIALRDANVWHARCVGAKARDSAGLGYHITSDEDDPPETERDRLQNFFDGQADLLTETLYRAQLDFESIGWGALEVVRKGFAWDGEPEEINHIPAHTLRRSGDRVSVLQRIGKTKIWFRLAGQAKDVDRETGKVYEPGALSEKRRASEIIWWSQYDPRSKVYGSPDWMAAIGTLTADFYRREYNAKFFQDFGIPHYAVTITGNYDPGELDENGEYEIQKLIKAKFADIAKSPHKTLVLALPSRGGEKSDITVTFEPLATDIKEASFRLYRKDNRDEIVSAHGVNPYRVGIMETGSLAGNLGKQAADDYKNGVIEPRQNMLEDLIDLHIIRNGFGFEHWKFELLEIDNSDELHEIALHEKLLAMKAITVAEVRKAWAARMGIESEMPDELLQGVQFAVVGLPTLVAEGLMTENEARKTQGLPPKLGGDNFRDPRDADLGAVEKALKSIKGDA